MKKTGWRVQTPAGFWGIPLALLGSSDGAGASASAALDALVRIDDVLAITLRDRFHGALSRASAAADAFVTDNVSHSYTSNRIPAA